MGENMTLTNQKIENMRREWQHAARMQLLYAKRLTYVSAKVHPDWETKHKHWKQIAEKRFADLLEAERQLNS